MAFDNLSEQQVNKAVALLNNRPRKSLDYQTPLTVLYLALMYGYA
jgi:IS30 family transposase